MVDINGFLVQLSQPYMLYSVVFLSVAFVCIKIYLKFNPYLSRRSQSLLWLLPLTVPLFVFSYFPPQTQIVAMPFAPINVQIPSMGAGCTLLLWGHNVFSYAGLLCICGVIASAGYIAVMLFLGPKIAMRRFHVVPLAKDEYIELQAKVKEVAQKLGISVPHVGLVDDLMPNAFTTGYGRNATVVFSLGLIEMLDAEELSAVASHELAHIKAKDYLFKSLSYTLNFVSFFNPLSYLAAAQAQKERELLADQKSVALLDKPHLMANVLTRIEEASSQFTKASLTDRLSASLFLVSPLAHRPAVLASHPKISQRIKNIQPVTYKPALKHKKLAAALLLGMLLCLIAVTWYSTVEAQKSCSQTINQPLHDYRVLVYNSTAFDSQSTLGALFFDDLDSYLRFTSGLPKMWGVSEQGQWRSIDGTEMTFHLIKDTVMTEGGNELTCYFTDQPPHT